MPITLPTPQTFIDSHRLIASLGGGPAVRRLFKKHKQPLPTEGQLLAWAHRYQIPAQWFAALVLLYEAEKKTPLILRNFIKIGDPPWYSTRAPLKIDNPNLSPLLTDLKTRHKVRVERPGTDKDSVDVRAREERQKRFMSSLEDPFAPPAPPVQVGEPAPASPPVNILAEAEALLVATRNEKSEVAPVRRRVIDF